MVIAFPQATPSKQLIELRRKKEEVMEAGPSAAELPM